MLIIEFPSANSKRGSSQTSAHRGYGEGSHKPTDLVSLSPCALVLGGFDGLHLGHRTLLEEAKKSGLPVAVTTMLGGKGRELFTEGERRFLFERAGVDRMVALPFTEELKNTSAEDFLARLFSVIDARLVVCGEDYRFGKDAAGNAALLKTHAPCPVKVVPILKSDPKRSEAKRMRKISASACKVFLKKGELFLLNACLYGNGDDFYDHAYFVQGVVEHGRGVGRTYGFPTLNLSVPPEKLLPPDGVYGGLCATPKGNFPTIVNFGSRPTFGVAERKTEAYLDGFSGDLYGAEVRVYPMEFFRPIIKFPSAEALKEQLEIDVARLRS